VFAVLAGVARGSLRPVGSGVLIARWGGRARSRSDEAEVDIARSGPVMLPARALGALEGVRGGLVKQR
jgi:hypothetical protein